MSAETEKLIERASYYVGNPSAWEQYDDGVSEVVRELCGALASLTAEVERLRTFALVTSALFAESAERIDQHTAEVSRPREALALAANRLDRLALELPFGGTLRSECTEWVSESRANLEGR